MLRHPDLVPAMNLYLFYRIGLIMFSYVVEYRKCLYHLFGKTIAVLTALGFRNLIADLLHTTRAELLFIVLRPAAGAAGQAYR